MPSLIQCTCNSYNIISHHAQLQTRVTSLHTCASFYNSNSCSVTTYFKNHLDVSFSNDLLSSLQRLSTRRLTQAVNGHHQTDVDLLKLRTNGRYNLTYISCHIHFLNLRLTCYIQRTCIHYIMMNIRIRSEA